MRPTTTVTVRLDQHRGTGSSGMVFDFDDFVPPLPPPLFVLSASGRIVSVKTNAQYASVQSITVRYADDKALR